MIRLCCTSLAVSSSAWVASCPALTQVSDFTLTCEECLGKENQVLLSLGTHTAWIFRTSLCNHVSFFFSKTKHTENLFWTLCESHERHVIVCEKTEKLYCLKARNRTVKAFWGFYQIPWSCKSLHNKTFRSRQVVSLK